MNWIKKYGAQLTLILCGILVFYRLVNFGSLDFVDSSFIDQNFPIKKLTWINFISFFQTQLHPIYSPVGLTALMIEGYLFYPELTVYHTFNICLHIVSCLLLYRMFGRFLNANWKFSFFIALVYLLHPVQLEPVSWLSQQPLLLSMLFFIMAVDKLLKHKGFKLTIFNSLGVLAFLILSVGSHILAVCGAPLLIWLILQRQKQMRQNLNLILATTVLLISSLAVLLNSLNIKDVAQTEFLISSLPYTLGLNFVLPVINFLYPGNIAFGYNPDVDNSMLYLISAVILISLTFGIIQIKKYNQNNELTYGLLLLIGTLIVSPLLEPINYSDYHIYFSLYLFLGLIFIALFFIKKLFRINSFTIGFGIIIIGYFSIYSFNYLPNYNSESNLWKQRASKYNDCISKTGFSISQLQHSNSIQIQDSTINSKNNNCDQLINYLNGKSAINNNDVIAGTRHFEKNLKNRKSDWATLKALSEIYISENQLKKAKKLLYKALDQRFFDANSWSNMAVVYLLENNLDSAITSANISVRCFEKNADGWLNLGIALSQKGETRYALDCLNHALKYDGQSSMAFKYRGDEFWKLENRFLACQDYMQGYKLDKNMFENRIKERCSEAN